MRIFISHATDDEILASKLKEILEKDEEVDEAHMAIRTPDFEIEIADKIRREIRNSDYVVAIITDISKEKPSVHQELGFSQGVETFVIPLIEQNQEKGVLLHGRDSFQFKKNNFEESCKEVLQYIKQKGPRPKFSKEEENFVQRSAHFRYEIKNCFDDLLDSVIYRLGISSEKNRDFLFSDKHEERLKMFNELYGFFDQETNTLLEYFSKIYLNNFSRIENDLLHIRNDVNDAKKLPHDDLFPEESDAFHKFNRQFDDVEDNSFDVKKDVKKYFEDDEELYQFDFFTEIMNKYPDMVPAPLTNYFRMKLVSFAGLIKSVVLLEMEIEKTHIKFGRLALKDTSIY